VDIESNGQATELGRGAQVRIAGLVVGIMAIKPDEDHPAVRLAVRNLRTDQTQQPILVPGEPRALLDHTLEVVSINRQPPESVMLRAEADEVES